MWTYLYDLETLINCFIAVFVEVDKLNNAPIVFEISDYRNDEKALAEFLDFKVKGLIGFNCYAFDSPILSQFMKWFREGEDITPTRLWSLGQDIIHARSSSYHSTSIPHIDLFRTYHYDHPPRSTSLKWIQCHLGMDLIEDMPLSHDHPVTEDQVDTVKKYCINDVATTKALWHHPTTRDMITLRKELGKIYLPGASTGIKSNFYSTSNAGMGEFILISEIIKTSHMPVSAPHQATEFRGGDIMLPVCNNLRGTILDPIMNAFRNLVFPVGGLPKFKVIQQLGPILYDFALGGLHASWKNSLWENVTIHSFDVTSFYPMIAIKNRLCPGHLGDNFNDAYITLYNKRMKHPKGSTINKGLKEALVSVFGKSNEKSSQLYDPKFTFAITINGQLILALLCLMIYRSNAGRVIMVNTDGIEVIANNETKLAEVIKEWTDITHMPLESTTYTQMLIRDVNNYIARKGDGTFKKKGAYATEVEFHKDPSMSIVPMAVEHTLKTGEGFRDYINDRSKDKEFFRNFFMYARAKTGEFSTLTHDGKEIPLPKTLRYIISKNGYILRKVTDKKKEKVHATGKIAILNDLRDPEIEDIEIDTQWYMHEAAKLLRVTTSSSNKGFFMS